MGSRDKVSPSPHDPLPGQPPCAVGRVFLGRDHGNGIVGRGMRAFHIHHTCLAAFSGAQRPCATRDGWMDGRMDALLSLPCEQVLPAVIHVVSGWAAMGGHPGAGLAPHSMTPWGGCSHQPCGLSGLRGGVLRGSQCRDEHKDLGSAFPTCSSDCLLLLCGI